MTHAPVRWRPLAALLLSAVALVVVLVGAPHGPALVLVGLFLLATPGLLLVEALELRDGLLGLVLGMMAGPVLWVVLATAEVFVGAWHPRAGVVLAALLLGGAASYLLLRARRTTTPSPRFRVGPQSPREEG